VNRERDAEILAGVHAGAPAETADAALPLVRGMLDLRRSTNQHDFVRAFLAVMSVEPDGVRVRMNLTWPRPKKKGASKV